MRRGETRLLIEMRAQFVVLMRVDEAKDTRESQEMADAPTSRQRGDGRDLHLDHGSMECICSSICRAIGANQTITELNLNNNGFGDGLASLSRATLGARAMGGLLRLYLNGNGVGDDGAVGLGEALAANDHSK